MAFANEGKITDIEYWGRVRCYCPLGRDFYSADVVVSISDPQMIPDYCDLDAKLRKMDGKELTLEEACYRFFKFCRKQIKHGYLKVSVYSADATHSPVKVSKWDYV